ncbi:MAG: Sensor histidine kinase YycG [Syntrophorhabdus sp. PtaU1.Bin002]|nr:MAG: Sensor histidine kinase YycG [Syntrophorhabdus sp. PtaB.Bin006]OPY71245.1 MAG: Sensor histidine kinase YycG [Syntrophorhabdus sp. PtaU1.Bin002]
MFVENMPGKKQDSRGKGADNLVTGEVPQVTALERSLTESNRKLHSLLELGQIIGLDLQIEEMLVRIAEKAAEVMGADRFSLFLYDRRRDELFTTVALGLNKEEIRIPSSVGLAGHSFQTGKTLNIADAHQDPRFLQAVDKHTGYQTKSVLCMPFFGRSGQKMGVVELINKKDSEAFAEEDEAFLKTFSNHAAVFLEMAQLQEERMEALRKSHGELECLNVAKSRALDHLAHELRTPIALMQGVIRLLKPRLEKHYPQVNVQGFFEILEKNLSRLLLTQQTADRIVRASRGEEGSLILDELERLGKHIEEAVPAMPREVKDHIAALKEWMIRLSHCSATAQRVIPLYRFAGERIEQAEALARHRMLRFFLEGEKNVSVIMEQETLKGVVNGLIRNAAENTPDEGTIRVRIEQTGHNLFLKIEDSGIGITDEDQGRIFEGLFHARHTDLYGTRKPYDFDAGGKGLDLLLMKIYGQRFGFDLTVQSKRCTHIPTDRDTCPGQISRCPHCKTREDCAEAGWSTFILTFPTTSIVKGETL